MTGRTIIHSHFHRGGGTGVGGVGHHFAATELCHVAPTQRTHVNQGARTNQRRTMENLRRGTQAFGENSRGEHTRAYTDARGHTEARIMSRLDEPSLNLTALTPFPALMTHRTAQLGFRLNGGKFYARGFLPRIRRPYVNAARA